MEEPVLQGLWDWILAHGGTTIQHWLFPSVVALFSFFASCLYFTYLDVTRNMATKVQKHIWPSNKDMMEAAIPQMIIYIGLNSASWFFWNERAPLPLVAPSLYLVFRDITLCLIIGDFLIYWEHRIMHIIPYARNHIHSVHHTYHAPFSWAGGWVHPLEDAVVIVCQIFTPYVLLKTHPLIMWIFAFLWPLLLVEEHSGHDVWWSPYNWIPFSWGGGAAPHDIHHIRPWKNYAFVFCLWDKMFNTFEAPNWDIENEQHAAKLAEKKPSQKAE